MNLNEVYENQYQLVYQYIKKHLWQYIDESNIHEIINQAFFTFFNKINQNCFVHNQTQYICSIAYNIMRNTSMYKKRYYIKNIEFIDAYEIQAIKKDLLTLMIEKERHFIIMEALNTLNENERKIIIYYYFYDFNRREICMIMNIKYSKLNQYIKKGLKNLKEYFITIHYDPC